jgi:hypothetical protein
MSIEDMRERLRKIDDRVKERNAGPAVEGCADRTMNTIRMMVTLSRLHMQSTRRSSQNSNIQTRQLCDGMRG